MPYINLDLLIIYRDLVIVIISYIINNNKKLIECMREEINE